MESASTHMQVPAALTVARQLDQEKIGLLSERAEKLIKSNGQLRVDIVRNERANEAMASHYQGEMAKKDSTIARLQTELDRVTAASAKQIEQMRSECESTVSQLRSINETQEQEYSSTIRRLENELGLLEMFRNEKELHDAKLAALEEKLEQEKRATDEAVDEIEKKFIKEKFRHMRENEDKVSAVRAKTLVEAHGTLREQQLVVQAENERLFEDLKIHQAFSEALERDCNALKLQCEEQTRLVEMYRDKERSAAEVGQVRGSELKRLRQRVGELETERREKVREHARSSTSIRAALAKDLEESSLDAAGLRTLLAYKNKELRSLTALCATILNQRSDVETFFLQALKEVREKMSKEKPDPSSESRRATMTSMRMGTYKSSKLRVRRIIAGESESHAELIFPKLDVKAKNLKYWDTETGESHIEIKSRDFVKDLSWEEKETVLRALFAKLNGLEANVKLIARAAEEELAEGADNAMMLEMETVEQS